MMSSMARKKDLLKGVPLFDGLTQRERISVAGAGKEVRFPAGKDIVEEGSAGMGFHLILEGEAKVTVRGKTRAKIGPGAYFGEISLLDRGPRTATVTAVTPVTTLSLVSWNFLPLIDEYPSIAKKMLVELCGRIRNLEKSITH